MGESSQEYRRTAARRRSVTNYLDGPARSGARNTGDDRSARAQVSGRWLASLRVPPVVLERPSRILLIATPNKQTEVSSGDMADSHHLSPGIPVANGQRRLPNAAVNPQQSSPTTTASSPSQHGDSAQRLPGAARRASLSGSSSERQTLVQVKLVDPCAEYRSCLRHVCCREAEPQLIDKSPRAQKRLAPVRGVSTPHGCLSHRELKPHRSRG